MNPSPELIDSLLDKIEELELLSLRWGYVDGSLSEQEVDSLADEVIASGGATVSPRDLVEALVSRSLLFEFSGADGFRYRSRFAEGVRLLTRLKQLMPHRPWLSSPDLCLGRSMPYGEPTVRRVGGRSCLRGGTFDG